MAQLFKKKYLHVPHLSVFSAFKEIGKNPFVDWIVILVIASLFAIILAGRGGYLYWAVLTGNITSSEETSLTPPRTLDQKALSSALKRLDAKEGAYVQAKRGYDGPADPSL